LSVEAKPPRNTVKEAATGTDTMKTTDDSMLVGKWKYI
jgi:hypothetical protein